MNFTNLKQFFLILFAVLLISLISIEFFIDNNESNYSNSLIILGPTTSIKFDEIVFYYGKVKEGTIIEHNFNFKNTGDNPLIISMAKGSCGCTLPDWPKESIMPGGTGTIKVTFNSANKGLIKDQIQEGEIIVTSNTLPQNTILKLKGIIYKN